jgi:hypothetical protein
MRSTPTPGDSALGSRRSCRGRNGIAGANRGSCERRRLVSRAATATEPAAGHKGPPLRASRTAPSTCRTSCGRCRSAGNSVQHFGRRRRRTAKSYGARLRAWPARLSSSGLHSSGSCPLRRELDPLPVSSDFTQKVLDRLSARAGDRTDVPRQRVLPALYGRLVEHFRHRLARASIATVIGARRQFQGLEKSRDIHLR